MKKTISCLEQKPGVECIVHSLGSDEKVAQRLAQMGVLPGVTLQIIRIAPFGTTVEVSIDGSQSFAIRKDELTALNCQVVAMPLTSSDVQLHIAYRIRTLSGGRRFQQRMEAQGIHRGLFIRINNRTSPRIELHLIDQKKIVKLGRGEAEKIIIEVVDA